MNNRKYLEDAGYLIDRHLTLVSLPEAQDILRNCYFANLDVKLKYSINKFLSELLTKYQHAKYEDFIFNLARTYEGYRFYQLKALPELPASIDGLFAHNCTSLIKLCSPSNITRLTPRMFYLSNCFKLTGTMAIIFFKSLLQLLLKSQLRVFLFLSLLFSLIAAKNQLNYLYSVGT